ncbi:hypothetical protein BH10ACT1_BH10ACT1_34040 [soil metagenome]
MDGPTGTVRTVTARFKDLCIDATDPEGNELCVFPPR